MTGRWDSLHTAHSRGQLQTQNDSAPPLASSFGDPSLTDLPPSSYRIQKNEPSSLWASSRFHDFPDTFEAVPHAPPSP